MTFDKFVQIFFTLERTNGEPNGIAYVMIIGGLLFTAFAIFEHLTLRK